MRIELLHPMLVHFPIALLLAGTGMRLAAYWMRASRWFTHLRFAAWAMLLLGAVFAVLAIIGGELAADVVEKSLCVPAVLELHETLAFSAALCFVAAMSADFYWSWKQTRFFGVFSAIFYGAAVVLLAATGYFGASLVYEQGAAVHKCKMESK